MPPLVSVIVHLLAYCTGMYMYSCSYISSSGLLDAVSNLKSDSLGQIIHLTWDAPFSLDITGVDRDIWYRVDILSTTLQAPFLSTPILSTPQSSTSHIIMPTLV